MGLAVGYDVLLTQVDPSNPSANRADCRPPEKARRIVKQYEVRAERTVKLLLLTESEFLFLTAPARDQAKGVSRINMRRQALGKVPCRSRKVLAGKRCRYTR